MAWIFQTDGNYVNFNGGGNLWRLHKDSSCITWHWDESGDLFFDVYDSEFIVKASHIGDLIIDGVPLSAASDFPDAIRAVFTGLAGGTGGSSYLVAEVELDNDQIIAWGNAAVDIVPAQAGKILLPIAGMVIIDTSGGAYGGISNSAIHFEVNGQNLCSTGASSGLEESAGIYMNNLIQNASQGSAMGLDNQPIKLVSANGGQFTDGNAGNTLKATVYYTEVDL